MVGAAVELRVTTPWARWSKGSTEAEQESCREGMSVHLSRSGEDRWCLVQRYVAMEALWLGPNALAGLEDSADFRRWLAEGPGPAPHA